MVSSYAFRGGNGKRKKEGRKIGRKGRKEGRKKKGKKKGRKKERKREKGEKEKHVGLIYPPFYQLVLVCFESIRRNAFPRTSPLFRYHCLLELEK